MTICAHCDRFMNAGDALCPACGNAPELYSMSGESAPSQFQPKDDLTPLAAGLQAANVAVTRKAA
jgi:hypothetical protein